MGHGHTNALAILTWKTGEYDRAGKLFEEALAHWEKHGPETNVAGILNNLGIVAADRGDFSAAQKFYHRSVDIYRRAGLAGLLATSLSNSGVNAMRLNDLQQASELLHEARMFMIFNSYDGSLGYAVVAVKPKPGEAQTSGVNTPIGVGRN